MTSVVMMIDCRYDVPRGDDDVDCSGTSRRTETCNIYSFDDIDCNDDVDCRNVDLLFADVPARFRLRQSRF